MLWLLRSAGLLLHLSVKFKVSKEKGQLIMDIANLVCVELKYQDNTWDFKEGIFKGPSPAKTGVLVMSSTITKSGKLQQVVCQMCFRMGWTPLVYRIVEETPSPRAQYLAARRALLALS